MTPEVLICHSETSTHLTSPDLDGVGALADLLEALLGDGSGEDGGGGGAISRLLVRVVRHILQPTNCHSTSTF